jgi:hypothetical protein
MWSWIYTYRVEAQKGSELNFLHNYVNCLNTAIRKRNQRRHDELLFMKETFRSKDSCSSLITAYSSMSLVMTEQFRNGEDSSK